MVRYLQRLEQLAPMGYTAGIHIRFASPLYLRSTYPKAWQDLYAANNYSLRDPLVFWGVSKSGQIRWSEINLPDPFGVMKLAAEHGLTFGAVCSCGKITSRTIVGVARSDREFTDAVRLLEEPGFRSAICHRVRCVASRFFISLRSLAGFGTCQNVKCRLKLTTKLGYKICLNGTRICLLVSWNTWELWNRFWLLL